MKKLLIGLALILATSAANADFFGGNNGEWKMGPNGPYYDESDWPEWTPMYWMEEMMDNFGGDDDNNSFGFGGGSNNYPMQQGGGYGYPQQQPQPYGYGYPQQPQMAAPAMPMPVPVAPR